MDNDDPFLRHIYVVDKEFNISKGLLPFALFAVMSSGDFNSFTFKAISHFTKLKNRAF